MIPLNFITSIQFGNYVTTRSQNVLMTLNRSPSFRKYFELCNL